jgi:formate hydrogenlyase subunit 6/NADH:ubiquinone oxidoreductase subunit I
MVGKTDNTWAIDHGRCILCGNCVEGCRENCITLRQQPYPSMQKQEVIRYR